MNNIAMAIIIQRYSDFYMQMDPGKDTRVTCIKFREVELDVSKVCKVC